MIDSQCDLSGYQLVAAPMLYLLKPGVSRKYPQVCAKGRYLCRDIPKRGYDENSLCFLAARRAADLARFWASGSEEIDALYPQDQNAVVFPDGAAIGAGSLRI